MKKKYSLPFFLSLAGLLFLAAWFSATISSNSLEDIALKASGKVSEKSILSKEILTDVVSSDSISDPQHFLEYYPEENIGLYLWQKDSLVFWNNSEIPLKIGRAHV